MSFASPIWLLGLVPWAALVVWLLSGQRRSAHVPFLALWRGAEPMPRAKRALHLPPPALAMLLLATLLAILAAGGPALPALGTEGRPITVIVDRGILSVPRFEELIELGQQSARQLGDGDVELVLVPDGEVEQTSRRDWPGIARAAGLTSLDTRKAMSAAVAQAQQRNGWPVLVLSDQYLGTVDRSRVIQVTTRTPVRNVGLVRVSAREHPRPQVMARVRNLSNLSRATLLINSGPTEVRRDLELPARGAEADVFVDLPRLERVISIGLIVEDDFAADNRAWLVRQHSWPQLEVRTALAPHLQRIAQVYARHRPPSVGSIRVLLAGPDELPVAQQPVVIVPASAKDQTPEPLHVAPHPVNESVNWTTLEHGGHIAVAEPPPGRGWQPVVSLSRAGRPLVAVRSVPARQVWVSFDSPAFARTPDFVMFWTNVFDWLGESSADHFAAGPVEVLGDGWDRREDLSGGDGLPLVPPPGVWAREPDGKGLRSLNVLDVRFDPPVLDQVKVPAMTRPNSSATIQLRSALLVAATSLCTAAAATWGGRRAGAKAA